MKPIALILALSHILFIIICIMMGFPFWKMLDGSQVGNTAHWNDLLTQHSFTALFAFLSVLLLGATISMIIALRIAFYFRQFNQVIKQNIERILTNLALMPALCWALILIPFCLNMGEMSAILNFGMGILLFFSMSFPMLLFWSFQQINSIPDDIIETGYSLGANTVQIAQNLILPQKIKLLSIGLILTYIKLTLELGIILMIIGILPIQPMSIVSILSLTTLSTAVLLIWGQR